MRRHPPSPRVARPRRTPKLRRAPSGTGFERPSPDVTFTRRVTTPLEVCLARVAAWPETGGMDALEVGASRIVVPPSVAVDGDRGRIGVILGGGHMRPPIPMEVDLLRWSAIFGTQLVLRPLVPVRPHRRYFAEGHAVLSRIQDMLEP